MKRILFNDKFGLTKAVLEGRKTMTRRLPGKEWKDIMPGLVGQDLSKANTPFKVGEVVAVAQSYLSIHEEMMDNSFGEGYGDAIYDPFRWAIVNDKPGWSNKMFVRADLMPHHIRITNVRVERLQDIGDEDCIREGLCWTPSGFYVKYEPDTHSRIWLRGMTYRSAFAELIDKVSGKGTWQANPYCFCYTFELIR